MAYFIDAAAGVTPRWRADGLRVAQLGALWAVASKFTTGTGPVQVVLPTGSGKTAVMTALPFSVPTTRVLVITPSRLVRDQVVDEFRTLDVLRSSGSAPADLPAPTVLRADHRMTDWTIARAADVVVGTPSVLSSSYPAVAPVPDGLFDLVLIDEAHHVAAPTWETLLLQFTDVRSALFTATPFRRDRRGLPGEIAYSYPLSLAIADEIFQPIQFLPVEVELGAERDRALAQRAAERLQDPVHQAAESAIIVRTDRIDEADRLVEIYADAGVSIGVVHSRLSLRSARSVLRRLAAGELRGIASVGVLGEGFDLPKLKIAVYHQRHKSLPATLQFVGRIARVQQGVERPPAELIAIREDVQDETRQLYADDAAWGELLPAISEAAVDRERARREYLRELQPSEDSEFSIYALQPRFQAEVYALPEGTDIDLGYDATRLAGGVVLEAVVDEAGELLAVVTRHLWSPEWLQSDVLDTYEHRLHMVVLDRDRSLLFISTSSESAVAALLFEIGAEGAPKVAVPAMNRFLHGLDVLSYSSIGMRSARAPSPHQATYRMIASSAAQRAVRQGESRSYGVGHLIGRHRSEDGAVHAIGISVAKRKVFSPETGDLLAYKEWCRRVGALMQAAGAVGGRAPLLDLQMPADVGAFDSDPLIALLDWQLTQGGTMMLLDSGPTDLADMELLVEPIDVSSYRIRFEFDGVAVCSTIIDISGRAHADGPDPVVVSPDGDMPLTEVLWEWPHCTYFADGSSVYGSVRFPGSQELQAVPAEVPSRLDWTDVDIRRESKPGRHGRSNIQQRMVQWANEMQPDVVIVDDSANELADVVAVHRDPSGVVVTLIHCKWSSEDQPGQRLVDVHDVTCQAVRSARWSGSDRFFARLLARLERDGQSHLVGDAARGLATIAALAERPIAARFNIVIAQPGLRIDRIDRHEAINSLLVNATDWIRSQGADLVVLGT